VILNNRRRGRRREQQMFNPQTLTVS